MTDEQIQAIASKYDDPMDYAWTFSEENLVAFARALLANPSDKQEAKPRRSLEAMQAVSDLNSRLPRLANPSDKQEAEGDAFTLLWRNATAGDAEEFAALFGYLRDNFPQCKQTSKGTAAWALAALAQSAEQDTIKALRIDIAENDALIDELREKLKSAEQDRIDAERWRYARQLQRRPDEYDAYIDRQRAKGASK